VSSYEVPEPILNSPFEEPAKHWRIAEGEEPRREPGRRPASYFYRPPGTESGAAAGQSGGTEISLVLVNRIRARVEAWRRDASQPYAGVSRTTRELIEYWRRDGRQHRLFFAQLEAVETIIFLVESRPDLRQGIEVPLDEPSEDRQAEGYRAFRRYACKMATGSGKTTVMGMLAAWSILNKVADRGDARFSDVVLVVCPNVTIRNRLQELDPLRGEASLYRTRDLVPGHMMQDLAKGRVLLHNWHAFEPQGVQTGGVSARVNKAGRAEIRREVIHIGARTTNARGKRYLTREDLDRQMAAGLLTIRHQERDADDNLVRVEVEAERYVESDASLVNRILGREVGGKQNILVMNDEAHHAYRIRRQEPAEEEDETYGEDDEADWFFREATVWVDGLDRIHKLRGINFCLDVSATPYFLGRVGQDTNRPFPWVVSDFGLIDAIESGLVKVPQLAVRDTSGDAVPGYFNIWRWVMDHLTPAERGGAKGSVKPEAVLKWAFTPIAMLGGLWEELRAALAAKSEDPRPPVFIIVCKNTRLAKVVYDWLARDQPPHGVPSARLAGFRNTDAHTHTIRVDTKVVHETDTGQAKSDEFAWMRFTLDTVGRVEWPKDGVGRPIYAPEFEALAEKLGKPLHPPGRDVRCIVSVGMLTEGWDCNTVTHIIGLRPFTSQLLCEQVVGRGLRRTSYDIGDDGLLREEVAKILGVPFEVIPFKQNQAGPAPPPPQRHRVNALPGRKDLEIRFPRVEGYRQAIRNRVTVDWKSIAPLRLDPMQVPPEIQMKAHLPLNQGRPSVLGPGALEDVTLNPYRQGRRLQELSFLLAKDLTRTFSAHESCLVPPQALFPQIQRIADRYLRERVDPVDPAEIRDVFMSPYYGWVIERLIEAIRPDTAEGEDAELPRYEANRGPGTTADVDFWTSKDVREVVHSHLNYVVADTLKWEQSAAYAIDGHATVHSFAKNAGLGFAIPYLHNGQPHDYLPDFIVRLKGRKAVHVILEVKGFDPLKEIKQQAAERWVAAVNAEGSFGAWRYAVAQHPSEVKTLLVRFEAEGS
jgi:type III restriction enzyme